MTKHTVEVILEDAAHKRMRTEVAASIVNRQIGHDPLLGPRLPFFFLCRAGLFRDMVLEAESHAIDFYVIEVIMQDHLHHLA